MKLDMPEEELEPTEGLRKGKSQLHAEGHSRLLHVPLAVPQRQVVRVPYGEQAGVPIDVDDVVVGVVVELLLEEAGVAVGDLDVPLHLADPAAAVPGAALGGLPGQGLGRPGRPAFKLRYELCDSLQGCQLFR